MEDIKLHDKTFEIYIQNTEIADIITAISKEINATAIERPLFIAVLNGSFLFAADLMRKITLKDAEISFVKLSSYQGTESTGKVNELIGINQDIKGRNIILIEDIIDTGNTLAKAIDIFKNKEIASLRTATLLYKPDAFKHKIPIEYIGKSIPNDFVIGYGLDYDEIGRTLPHIYKLKK